jgi:hypothetical protein
MEPVAEQECLGIAFHNRRLKAAGFSHSRFSASHLRADAADDTSGKTSRSFDPPSLWLISLGAELPADDLPKRVGPCDQTQEQKAEELRLKKLRSQSKTFHESAT